MVGINRYDDKARREIRRRNHIARDLKTDKYHQRIIPDRKRKKIGDDEDEAFYDYEEE